MKKIDAFDAQYGTRTIDMIKAAGDDRAMFYSESVAVSDKIETDVISGLKMDYLS